MDQAPEDNFVTENLETVPGSNTGGVTEVMDSYENAVEVVPDIQSKYMKNKIGDAKQKFQNDKTKEMTVASVPERKILKRKAAHPPTSEMVMDSIKALKKRNGVSFEDIRNYLEEKYEVDMKRLKYNVDKFLQKGVGNGILEKIDREGTEGRFKIKKSENIKNDPRKLPRKDGKVKPEKKLAAAKKQVNIKKDPKNVPGREKKVKPGKKLGSTKMQVNIKKDPKNLPREEGKVKPEKKSAATKIQVKW